MTKSVVAVVSFLENRQLGWSYRVNTAVVGQVIHRVETPVWRGADWSVRNRVLEELRRND